MAGWESSALHGSEQRREPQLRAGPDTDTKANIWKGSYCPKISANAFRSKAGAEYVGSRESPTARGSSQHRGHLLPFQWQCLGSIGLHSAELFGDTPRSFTLRR